MDEVSKREIRAKRLVAAVLLAISVQMWSAPPLWAAEASVQTETSAAGEAKETKDAKDAKAADSETGGEADAGEEETVVVPVIGYSTRSAAGSDYGVMPLADTAVDGALTGVTSINDAKFYADTHDLLLGYDAKSQGTGTVALGSDANAGGQYSTAIGASASATAENSSALGMYARAGFKDSVAIGFSSNATADNMVSFGVTENGGSTWTTRRSLEGIANIDMEGTINLGGTWTKNASGIYESNGKGELTGITKINGIDFQYIEDSPSLAIGTYLSGDYSYSLAIGGGADAAANNATAVGFSTSAYGENSTAIGNSSTVYEKSGTAIGASAYVQNGHTGSVAIGYDSATTAANQVAFGTGTVTTDDGPEVVTWTNRRSLAGISDIDMEGALTGVTSINGNVLVPMNEDVTNKSLAIGTGAAFTSRYSSETICKNAIVIGNGTSVAGDGALAIGYYANQREGSFAGGIGSIAINGWVSDGNYSVAINGFVAEADNVVAIGYRASSDSNNGVAIGSNAYASYDGTALGYAAQGNDNNAVAIGAYSGTTEENQVSFGHKAGDTNYADYSKFTDDLFRSLTNVADIEMHGALTGVTGIDGVTVSGTDASTGLTVGGNAVIGKTDTPFSSTGFAVAKDGAVTAKTVNGATITGTGFNGVTLSTDGKVNGAAITSNSFNGVKLEKGADSHYKVGGVDVTKMQTDVAGKADAATVTALDTRVGKSETDIGTLKTTVGDSSKGLVKDTADLKAAVGDSSKGLVKQVSDVDTAYKAADTVLQGRAKTLEDKTAGISRSGSTTTLETNTSVSSSGITTNKATVSGATATTLENGKLTVGAATVQNTGFAVGSSSLNNGSLTVDGNNKLTTAGLTASKVTVGAVTVSGGKVSGLTDAALSAVSTEAVTGKQLNATNTTVSALDTAYKAADTQIRTDFAAADTTLQNNIDAKVAQAAYDTKMSDLDSADTALGSRAAALETAVNDSTTGLAAVNTKVGALDTAYQAADTQIRTDFAAADNALKTELNTAIDEKAKKATDLAGYGITDAYTKNDADAKITAATADMATKTQLTADIGIAKTALESAYQAADTALSDRAAALETAATGMSYDAGKNTTTFTGGVTATVLTAGEFKVGATGFGFGNDGALTAKTVNGIEIKKDESKVMVGGIDLTALSNGDVVTDNTKGIGRNQDTATTTIETNTAISSSGITTNAVTASGTVKASEFVEGSQKLSDKYAAKTALADYTTTTDMNTKFADYATTTAVDTKLADYAKSDSVYSKAAADTAFAKAGDVDTLKTTVGDTDGGLVKDVKDLQSGKADNATTLAGYGIADAYTQTEINEKIVEATKDLATSATVTDIQSGLEEVTGKTAGLSYDTASGSSKFSGSVVIGNEGAKTHTQITDDAIIFGEGTDKQVTVDASGIHVGKKAAGGIALYADADGTHIDHTSLVTGSVTADNLNGVAISGNATDGLSVGGVSIKALSERLDSLEQDGVATADMGGIKRTDVVENSGKTIIEDTTSFTKDGLKTANLEAATAALGGVNFAAGAVTGVSSINGVVFGSDGKIGGVSLSGGKVDGVDVGWLDQRVKSLEDNGTGGGGTGGGGSSANTSGIHKPDGDTTNIEGNTSITTDGIDTNKVNASDSIVVADGEKNKTVISKDGILVAEGEKNQVKINEDGIHVGKNSSVVNDTDGFITDKGLYIGVSSSSDTSTAKFSVAPNGNLSSKAGDYGFSNTSADGAKFTHSGDTAYGTGSQLDTTI